MKITTELVRHLAELSRLEFSDEEVENFKEEFSKTLSHIQDIERVDVSGIKNDSEVLDAERDLREDEIKQSLSVKQVTKNAPDSLGGSIVVPAVMED